MVNPQIIGTFDEFVEACEDVYQACNGIVWYRGHASAMEDWKLQPSVYRASAYRSHDRKRVPYAETNMAHLFRVHAPLRYPNCPPMDDLAGWLSLMQHHGLPTRLLDWTEAPLTALFFAMEGSPCDKAIWVLDPLKLNEITLSKREVFGLWEPEVKPFITQAFQGSSTSRMGDVVAVHASEIDLRILMQQGSFTVHATDAPLEDRPDADQFLKKFVIPAGRRYNFNRAIKIFAIRRSNVYPDLTNLASEIRITETDEYSRRIVLSRAPKEAQSEIGAASDTAPASEPT